MNNIYTSYKANDNNMKCSSKRIKLRVSDEEYNKAINNLNNLEQDILNKINDISINIYSDHPYKYDIMSELTRQLQALINIMSLRDKYLSCNTNLLNI